MCCVSTATDGNGGINWSLPPTWASLSTFRSPDGFRVDIGESFTFKVLDGDGAESPTYTVTLEQIPDIMLSLSPGSITESSTPSAGGRVTVTGTLTGPTRELRNHHPTDQSCHRPRRA